MTASKYPERYPQLYHKLMTVLQTGESKLSFPFPTGKAALAFIRELNGFVKACRDNKQPHWNQLVSVYDAYFARMTHSKDPQSDIISQYKDLPKVTTQVFVHILNRDMYMASSVNVGSIIDEAFNKVMAQAGGEIPISPILPGRGLSDQSAVSIAHAAEPEDPLEAFKKQQEGK